MRVPSPLPFNHPFFAAMFARTLHDGTGARREHVSAVRPRWVVLGAWWVIRTAADGVGRRSTPVRNAEFRGSFADALTRVRALRVVAQTLTSVRGGAAERNCWG